jgi:hypothetical protein
MEKAVKKRLAPKCLGNAYGLYNTLNKTFKAQKVVAFGRIREAAVYHIKNQEHFKNLQKGYQEEIAILEQEI